MNSLAHDIIFSSYSASAKAPAPASAQVVHSTLFSSYSHDLAERVAALAPRAKASQGLLARLNVWLAARKARREEQALWELAKTDARVMNEINGLVARTH